MRKITAFSGLDIKDLRSEINAALANIASSRGITLSLGTIRYSGSEFRVKLTGRVPSGSVGSVGYLPTSASDLLVNALRYYGLPTDARRFRVGATVYTLSSAKLSRPKYPFIGVGPQGGRYRFTVGQVKAGLI